MSMETAEEGFNRWRDRALEAELEIERLRAELERRERVNAANRRQAQQLLTENARLRADLKEATAMTPEDWREMRKHGPHCDNILTDAELDAEDAA